VIRILILLPLGARKGHAVVGGYDYERVAERARFLKHFKHAAEVAVEVFYLERVVQQVVAHHFVVGPIAGNVIYIRELFATFGDAAAILIPAVRLMRAIPEAPWFAFGRGAEEVREIARVIGVGDAFGRRRRGTLIERLAGHLARLSARVGCHSRRPTLRRHPGKVSVVPKRLDEVFELRREITVMIAAGFELPGVASGKNAGA